MAGFCGDCNRALRLDGAKLRSAQLQPEPLLLAARDLVAGWQREELGVGELRIDGREFIRK